MRAPLRLVILVRLGLGLGSTSIAAEGGFKVIVNPGNGVDTVDRDFLRDAFLKKATEWKGGMTIHPIDLPSKQTARDKFREDVLRKTSSQLKKYWSQQIFSGKGVPPPEATPDDVIAYVLANKGAVGYLPAGSDPGKAKVIRIR